MERYSEIWRQARPSPRKKERRELRKVYNNLLWINIAAPSPNFP